jgi:AraC-like DNA-binding protein
MTTQVTPLKRIRMTMQQVLFPPYTAGSLAQRFPDDPQAREEIFALRCWLYDQRPLATVLADRSLSRRTLYRLRERWERHGLLGLLTRRSATAAQRVSVPVVRGILRRLARGTSFMLGCDPHVTRLLAHPDPAHRGQLMAQALTTLIHDIDYTLHTTRGISSLLERHYLRGESLDEIAASVHCSTRTLSRLNHYALGQIAQRLPATLAITTVTDPWSPWLLRSLLLGRDAELAALEQHLRVHKQVGMVGLAGVGKSTLAAQLADCWQRAGWNVCWLRARPVPGDLTRDMVEQLYAQLARYGAIDVAEPDSSLALMDQLSILRLAVQRMPTLVVIDDVQHLEQNDAATSLLRYLTQRSETTRIVLVGRALPLPWRPLLAVEGLPSELARGLYTRLHGSVADAEWTTLYRWHRGNPQLLQLIARPPLTAPAHAPPTYTIIHELVSGLSRPARRILQWLWWWDEPLPGAHPFRRAIPGSQAAWQELIRQHVVTVRDNTYLLHDLIRDHLKAITDVGEWRLVREQIEQYVVLHATQPWACRLGYQCAVDTADWLAQSQWSGALARWAERAVQPHQAMFWWQRQWEAAQQLGDQQGMISAALAGVACGVALVDAPAILGWLERLPAELDVAQQWYAAFYRVQALRLLNDYEQAYQLLQSAPLAGAIPDTIDASGRWHYQVELVHWKYLRGNSCLAWQHYQMLPPPPTTSTLYQQFLYYRLGLILARNTYAYHECLRISRISVKLARSVGSAFLSAQAMLSLVYSLIATEQYGPAERKLRQVLPSLDDSWLALKQRAATYQSLLQCYRGDLKAGQQWADIAWKTSEELGWNQDYYMNWLQGLVAFRCGQTERALAYFGSNAGQVHQINQWTWIAEVLVYLHQPQEAHTYLRKILDVVGRQRDHIGIWDLHVLWGDLQQLSGHTRRAMRHFAHAVAIYSRLKLPVQTAEACVRMAECYLVLQEPQRALHYSLQATAKIRPYAIGLLHAPRIWSVHAQALAACDQDATPAWQTALRHLIFQVAHAPESVAVEQMLDQPHYRDIVRYGGGVDVLAARIRRARRRLSSVVADDEADLDRSLWDGRPGARGKATKRRVASRRS